MDEKQTHQLLSTVALPLDMDEQSLATAAADMKASKGQIGNVMEVKDTKLQIESAKTEGVKTESAEEGS